MSGRLIESLATTEPVSELFSDASVLQAMLDFEKALARAEANVGVIPASRADAIAAAATADSFDTADLVHGAFRAGTLSIPLVKALTEKVRASDPSAAGYVHWGATSQDVADSALMLILKRAREALCAGLTRLEDALLHLSEAYSGTTLLGRTLMQPAPPVTLGLKAAGWLGSVARGKRRLEAAFDDALVLQFGGASGTLASLGEQGLAVSQELARELDLSLPEAPWHTHRDRLAELMCACGVLTASLGKMARDISLMMQGEIGEAAEPGGDDRGGSSTMPHKRNPIGCALTLAASHRVPGEVAAFLSAMVQEHERAVGGWQAEWPIVATIIQATGVALASMTEVAEGLSIGRERMQANIEATHGVIFAERAMMMLAPKLGRDRAHKVLQEATSKSIEDERHLAEVLAEMPEVNQHLDPAAIRALEEPDQYLGVAEQFRERLRAGTSKKER
ncbi:MAG TPA: 3-carboxy-cis,cis-muconate cycloisomerase [Terriglobales bacterium]|nr:3-carboxy-cis,cis-muconate cycloisomerase [Terriglobales bacterium]